MISSSDRALLVVDQALEHKREFLSTWEGFPQDSEFKVR